MNQHDNDLLTVEKEPESVSNKHPYLEIDEMKVAGIAIRTTNKDGQSLKDQPALWQKFFSDALGESIPNKLHQEDILGVYYNYESDYTGYYNFLIGFEVSDFKNIPDNFIKLTIPFNKYAVFNNGEKMNLGDKVYALWQSIWNSKLNRAYTFDIEEYELATIFSNNPNIKIYIGLK
jgi:predicted transcriptional regulator YdeE